LADAIHGNKSQGARQRALANFKTRKTRVLVATDIAARGIDVEELSHVINFEIPNIAETYVHRIGRTGRAGLSGVALSFCDAEEKDYLRDIYKLISKSIPVIEDHPYPIHNMVIEKYQPVNKNISDRRPRSQSSFNRNRKWSSKMQSNKV
jgi:ATP-dependent RNA helicase RhlE